MNTGSIPENPNLNPNVNSAAQTNSVMSACAGISESAQSRVAFQITALMSEQAEKLPYDVLTRLRFARDKAVQHARINASAVREAATGAVLVAGNASVTGNGGNASGALRLHPGFLNGNSLGNSGTDFWTRLGSVLPLIALVLGLLCIQHFHQRSQISAAAEVDAALLGDDLPFLAYSDPGFVEFLKSNEH